MGTTRDGTAVHACLEMVETIEEAAKMDAVTGLLHGGAGQVSELIRRVVAQVLEGE